MERFKFDLEPISGMPVTDGILVLMGQLETHYNQTILGRLPPEPPSSVQIKTLLENLINIVNPREKPTEARLRVLKARMRDYTEQEIIQAAHEFSGSTWHVENGQMSIDNLIAPTKFGRWYAMSIKPVAKEKKDRQAEAEELARFRDGN